MGRSLALASFGLALLAWGCDQQLPPAPPFAGAPAPVRSTAAPLAPAAPCADSFVTHNLDFTTTVRTPAIHLFDSNGAGVAAGDLDGDGQPDLVFANLDGPDTIFWNAGGFQFHAEAIDDTNSRAVNIVDVDGDDRPDIVFTHRAAGVSVWHNTGARRFVRQTLPGVLAPAYAMAWGDLSGDNALDLVTGAYAAELEQQLGNTALFNDLGGVYVYEHQGAGFVARRLVSQSQALALALPDLGGDGRPDIVVGNDFALPDAAWLHTSGGWTPTSPFSDTAESTMSFDEADIDNDGRPELFATDMKPYGVDVHTVAAWLPLMARMPQTRKPGDPQIMANVLEKRGGDGRFHNEAAARGLDATGWSWSAQFGDLNNDGWLDLYVVNGMTAAELFHYLPHDELVEQNQALRNDGTGHFAPAPGWGLGATAGGRGMVMADLNGDGRLDVVVNNLRAPAQVFENRLCGGASLKVDLRWPDSGNTRAIGARLALHTSAGSYYRDVRAGSGYLSGDPSQVHFGFPAGATPQQLDIAWPDGTVSSMDAPAAGTLLTVTRLSVARR